MECSTTLGSK